MGGPEISKEFEEMLNSDIDESYVNYIKVNDSKNIFNAARTPAVFLVILIIAYMTSGFCMMIGLQSLASLFNLVLGVALLAIVTWAYVKFSGELREIGSQLDTAAEWIWDEVSVLKDVYLVGHFVSFTKDLCLFNRLLFWNFLLVKPSSNITIPYHCFIMKFSKNFPWTHSCEYHFEFSP